MDRTQSPVCKMIVRGVIKAGAYLGLTSALEPVGPIVEKLIEETSAEVLDGAFEKLAAIAPEKKSDIHTVCQGMIPTGAEKYEPILTTAAELCMENLDFFQGSFCAEKKAAELSDAYLNQYQKQFEQAEWDTLSKLLPAVLTRAISDLQTELVVDPDFRRQLDTYLMGNIKELHERQERTEQDVDELKNKVSRPAVPDLDCKHDYFNKWKKSMFLHGPKAKRPKLPLCEVYQLPHYDNEKDNLHQRLQNVLDSGNDPENRMLVILGQPGSGKSTLITYLLNKCKFNESIRPIRVFQFRNLGITDWNNFEILPIQILQCIGLKRQDLSNSVLILDGLDEVNMSHDHCEFLNKLYETWAEDDEIVNFSLFITCRQNRINKQELDNLYSHIVTLCPLTEQQIDDFSRAYYTFTKEERHTHFSFKQKDSDITSVLGIPIILYMILALHIDVGSSTSMAEIYEKIFSPDEKDKKTSIYYRAHDTEHPITAKIAAQIHEFSKRIAVKIWDLHPDEAYVDSGACRSISIEITENNDIELHDLLIGQYFIEGQESHELYFVHRSIYEYFVAISLFDAIVSLYHTNKSPLQLFQDVELPPSINPLSSFANLIGIQSLLDQDITTYLFYFLKHLSPDSKTWWNEFLQCFLQYGLIDAVNKRHKGGTLGIREEWVRCSNIVLLSKEFQYMQDSHPPYNLQLTKNSLETLGYYSRMPDADFDFSDIQFNKIPFKLIDLSDSKFIGINLVGANLEGGIFSRANLQFSHLEYSNLCGAFLDSAHLEYALLSGTRLKLAHLFHTYFQNSNLEDANLQGVRWSDLQIAILPDGFTLPDRYEVINDIITLRPGFKEPYGDD